MSVINRGDVGKALWPGINSWYGEKYDEHSPQWPLLFEFNRATKAFEEDVGLTGFGLAAIKPEGDAVSYDALSQAFITRYQMVTYGIGFIITDEMIEDDVYMVVARKRAQALAFSMRQTKEQVGHNVYNRAFNSSYTGGDGLEMLSTAHLNYSGGTYQNELTNAADLSEAALEQALIDIGNWTNDRGLKINVMASSLHIPVELQFEAERILKSPLRYDSANHDVNALRSMGKFQKGVHVHNYFTDTDAWFIRTNCSDGAKYFERRADDFDEDNDFDTGNLKYKATARYAFGWTDPKGIYGSSGA